MAIKHFEDLGAASFRDAALLRKHIEWQDGTVAISAPSDIMKTLVYSAAFSSGVALSKEQYFIKGDTHMTITQAILLGVFIVATLVGYKIINRVPSLLHTPLMSGMNAFSGVTVLGCLMATALAVHWGSKILGFVAIVLAMINVVSGFGVTHRMLKMFHSSSKKGEDL